jgi:hypothetical protein
MLTKQDRHFSTQRRQLDCFKVFNLQVELPLLGLRPGGSDVPVHTPRSLARSTFRVLQAGLEIAESAHEGTRSLNLEIYTCCIVAQCCAWKQPLISSSQCDWMVFLAVQHAKFRSGLLW